MLFQQGHPSGRQVVYARGTNLGANLSNAYPTAASRMRAGDMLDIIMGTLQPCGELPQWALITNGPVRYFGRQSIEVSTNYGS